MIVCVCNNLNCRKVRAAIDAGAVCANGVYNHHGVQKQCGQCVETIGTMLDDAEEAAIAPGGWQVLPA